MFLIKTINKRFNTGQLKLNPKTGKFFCNGKNDNDKISCSDIELPPEPTTCCMSGCANCVWIDYAEQIIKMCNLEGDKAIKIILDKISDPNLRSFLQLELQTKIKKKS